MIKNKLLIFSIILIFGISIISSATMISANINQSQVTNTSFENGTVNNTNETNKTENLTFNKTPSDKKTKKLVSELNKTLSELDVITSTSDENVIAEYSWQNLQKLRLEVNNTQMDNKTKRNLFKKIDAALKKNKKAIKFTTHGNEKQASKQLKSEYNTLNDIENLLNKEKEKTIAENDTENLINATNKIKEGHEKGAEWILNENPEMKFTQGSAYFTNLEDKVTKIRSIIQELKANGVPVEIKVIDASELEELQKTGKIKENKTAKVHAFIPIIVVAGIALSAAGFAIAATYGHIKQLEAEGKYICNDCKFWMYATNIAAAEAGAFATLGLGLICMETLALAELGFGIIDWFDFVSLFPGGLFEGLLNYEIGLRGDGCNDKDCIFYKGKRIDLSVNLQAPDKVHLRQPISINATISNNKLGNASFFKVTLYENTTSSIGGTPQNFAPIATQTVSGLSGKNQTTVSFNWTPTRPGDTLLKVVVDSDNEIKETDEGNNEDSSLINVSPPGLVKCELYKTKVVNSTSDPSVPYYKVYYFKAEHPVLLESWSRTPTFIYITGDPVYSPVGFQAFYPYGAMWQYYANSPDGPWNSCFSNYYAKCEPGKTLYMVDHWASGYGYYQYFAVLMCTTPGPWTSCQIKTELKELWLIEKT